MDNPLLVLAGHAASWRVRAWPSGVEHHARRALVDWFAALLPGLGRPPASLLAVALAGERGSGRAICYVDGGRSGMRHAALLNATASHTVEFDDIHRDSGYHPGSATIAAALAVAQARGADMEALLRAIAAGYEVSCRIGLAVQPSHYRFWHTTGAVGTFGAATAAALLLGCDAGQIAHAIATAATMAGGLQQAFRGDGMSKPLHPGHAADAGTLAALAAIAGALVGAARIVLALLCLTAAARAEDAEPGACPAPGTVIVTSLGTTLAFTARQGLVCSVTPSGSDKYQTFGLVTLVNSMNYQADEAEIAKLWPLAVGKAVKFTAVRGGYRWIAAYTVTAKQDITVQAGRFSVYVVVYEETQISPKVVASHSALYHSIWTYYISTDVGYYVKMEYQSISGGPSAYYQHTPWEAVSISRPK